MFDIPDTFADFMYDLFAEEGQAWLAQLPGLLAQCEEQWEIKIGPPVANLSFNYVAPAVRADGSKVMLKTGLTDEFPSQPKALEHFAGQGMVQLVAYDEQKNAMLMEYLQPGTSLRGVENDEVAMAAMIQVMKKLWRPLPEEHFPYPSVEDWGKGFARFRRQHGGETGPIPKVVFEKAEHLFAELSASMSERVLLHGDLHQDNILSAEREPWLAVDPKGVIGEPAYEIGAVLRNFWPDILAQHNPKALMKRRIDQFAAELGFEWERVHSWALAQAVLSVVWTIEDTGKLEGPGLYFVNLLNEIKK